MSKLTVESIIRIYGSKVKEVKVFNEKKRAQAEKEQGENNNRRINGISVMGQQIYKPCVCNSNTST